jgi:signal transduction histidine kinase
MTVATKPLRVVLAGLKEQIAGRFDGPVVEVIPGFIDELVRSLSRGPSSLAEEMESALERAGVRFVPQRGLAALVRDYCALRRVIVESALGAGAELTIHDVHTVADLAMMAIAIGAKEHERRSDASLAAILRILPVGVVMADVDGRIVRANDADDRLWEEEATTLARDGAIEWSSRDRARVEAEARVLARSLRTGIASSAEEMEVVTASGRRKTVLTSSAPIHAPGGAVIGAVSVNVDVTDTRRAIDEARAAAVARDEIIAVVSHELRNPLGVIEGNALYIERRLAQPGADAESLRKRFDAIRRARKRMERLISDLLDISRLETGRLPLEMGAESAADLVNQACEDAAPVMQEQSLALQAEPADGTVRCDRDRVLQVFANLCGNAAKFTGHGGAVTVGAEGGERECRFFVRDTGPGIDPAQVRFVFEPFWQAGPPDRRGAGLGLAIARGIVEAHGGRIWVDSQLGVGTTFHFTLPRA